MRSLFRIAAVVIGGLLALILIIFRMAMVAGVNPIPDDYKVFEAEVWTLAVFLMLLGLIRSKPPQQEEGMTPV